MMDHASIQYSPLKSIKIPSLIDRTADFVERPLGRSPRRPPPRATESERPLWVALPAGSLYPQHRNLVTPCVPIPTRLAYRPNLRPPPQIGINPSANHPVSINGNTSSKGRKVIVSRQLSVNGNISFVVGTKFGGIINRDLKEVPLFQILNHVSQAELQRFENQDFLEEDIREANQPPPKPKGRPIGSKLIDGRLVLAGVSTGPSKAQKPRTHLSRPVVVIPSPSGTAQQSVALAPSARNSHFAVKVPAPNGSQQVAVRVPSFNGPQPDQLKHVSETDASSESSEDELSGQWPTRRPRYAMMAASGLAPLETSLEEETSREVSTSRTPSHEAALSYDHAQSPKRRRLETQPSLRATGNFIQLDDSHTVARSYSGKEGFFDKLFKQSNPLTSFTESDQINDESLKKHAQILPPMWPQGDLITTAAQDHGYLPPDSSFPPGFDRGRYPAQRRRRQNKFYNPKRTPVSVVASMSKPSIQTDREPQRSPSQSEVEDVDMVDMLEIRDEEAEREALLWQFQPTIIQQSRPHSSSLMLPKPDITNPPCDTIPRPAPFPPLAEKASLLARDILHEVNGQSHYAQPPPGPSIQVTTPEKSNAKRASLTPHYPRGVKFAPHTLSAIPAPQIHKTSPDHSTSQTKLPPSSKSMSFAIEVKMSPDTATSSKARLSESRSSSPFSRATTKSSVFNSTKPPQRDDIKLTIPTTDRSKNRINPPPPTNGTSSKHQVSNPTPTNNITKYFRPKSSPAKAPPPFSSEDDDAESEDQLTRASSHKTLNPTIPHVQSCSRREAPKPAPAPTESDSTNGSMNPETLPVHSLIQRTTSIRVLDDDSTVQAEVPDSENDDQEVSDTDTDDENTSDEESMQRSEQLSTQPLTTGFMRASGGSVAVEDSLGERREMVEMCSETDNVVSAISAVQSRVR